MCANHEHRYRIEIVIGANELKFDLVVNAKSVTDAISKADGYVFENYPGKVVNFSIYHMGYKTEEQAKEHGAQLTSLDELAKRKGLFLQGPPLWFGVPLPS